MYKFSFALLSLIAATASGAPTIEKRIAQTIADSTALWQQACLNAGGAGKCNPQSIASFTTLLAAAGPCDQQNQADNMIDLAKTLNNNADMIKLTQIFAQQPRNTPTSQSVPYCQTPPKNAELNGLFQCQFQGANLNVFVGGAALGASGTIPLGHSAPLNPLGSCPANPGGPIPAGQQLVAITQNPGVPSSGSGSQNASSKPASGSGSGSQNASSKPASGSMKVSTAKGKSAAKGKSGMKGKSSVKSKPPVNAVAASSSSTSSSGNFHLQNGLDAQKLNAQFATLSANSPCTAGESACVGSDFAQCVNGKFSSESCAGGTACFALPLVNKPGTSVTCTTSSDATARIAATGAKGGITGA